MQTAAIQLRELSPRFDKTRESLLRARHLPGGVYSSADIYAMEKERIFMTHWLSVGRAEEIPNVGDYMTFSVMNEPILISRPSENEIQVCMNMCLHRGVAVASGCGHAKDFSCPYHAWLFDVGGKLIAAPGMKESEVDMSGARLKPLPVKIWRGWIFTNFAEQPPSFEDYIAPYEKSLPGVHTLRSLDDAVRLRGALRPGRRLLVVGGGWIGLEVAATARLLGLQVCLIEGGSRLCARSVPADISNFLLDLHRRHGVDVQLKGAVTAIEPAADDGALRVRTHRGVELADVVVFGIGLEPNTELAVACDLQVENGIVVDARGQTSDPAIYAVGDVANQPCGWPGAQARLRLESWANAQGQGIAVGAALAGKPPVPRDLPWFWSDQYDVNLQVLGLPSEAGLRVVRGSMRDAKFCVFQIVEGALHSVVAVNMAKELKLAKRWHKQGRCPSIAELQDPDTRLERL